MTSTPCFGQPTKSHWSLWSVSEKTLPGRCHASVACTGQGPPADEMSNHATRLVNRFPPVTRYALSAWARHPVPIALGEMRQLGVIDEPARVTHRELVGFPCGVAVSGFAPADTPPLATGSNPRAGAIGPLGERVSALLKSSIRPPRFEVLSPGVVIRRRPQRLHPTGSSR